MVHRIFGWLGGYVKVRLYGERRERFLNLCRNHRIALWRIYWDRGKINLYFRVTLADFYRLRPIARKCRVRLLVEQRYGLPFLLGKMRRHASFCAGVALCCLLVVFLSSRIWGITIEGQSYHSKETILQYLDSIDIYGGMPIQKLQCNRLEEKLRKKYPDIGWVSAERTGSDLVIRVREVLLVSKQKKKTKGHLIAQDDGEVVSIVTRRGTAKVKAGKQVKKGDILISGVVRIYGDNQELLEKDYVHAAGTVVLRTAKKYEDTLAVSYRKKSYTGRERKIYEWQLGKWKLFYYNPLNNLETYRKYDIIREGGKLCPSLSERVPVSRYVKTFREVAYKKAQYRQKEAEKILEARYQDYLAKKKKQGYQLKNETLQLQKTAESYSYQGTVVFWKKQTKYRKISKKKFVYKENDVDGNNGNSN